MSDRRTRSLELADQVGKAAGARFIGGGKVQRFGAAAVEYEPLLVRTTDKDRSIRLLSVAEHVSADVALLIDVVLAQGRMLAEQSLEIDKLRTDVETLRAERVTTEVTKQVNDALLQAGRDGVGLEGFAFEVTTAETLTQKFEKRALDGGTAKKKVLTSWSATADLGAVMDVLKGAHLAAGDANETRERVEELSTEHARTHRFASKETTGSLKVTRVIPASSRAERT